MPLPTYQKQARQVGIPRQIQGGDRGNAGMLEEAQGKMSLAQKLSTFSSQLGQLAGNMAQDQAGKDAVRDVHNRKQKIADINNDDTLDDTERSEQISNLSEGANKAFVGVYSRAYDSAAKAAYSNQITVDAKEASNQAMIKANGDANMYAKQMKEFRDATVPNAPSEETGIIADLAINQYGSQGFKQLKMAEIRKDEAQRHQKSNSAIALQSTDIVSNMTEGDWVTGSQNLFKLEQTLKDGIENEWLNADDASLQMMKATETGILAYAKDRIAMLEPIEAKQFIQDFRDGKMSSEIPSEFFDVDNAKLADRMDYLLNKEVRRRDIAIETKAKKDYDSVKDTVYLLDNGEEVSDEQLVMDLKKNLKPEVKADLVTAIKDNSYLKQFDTLSLNQQVQVMNDIETKDDKTADELRLQKKYEKHYAQAQKDIANDPLTYSQDKAFDSELEYLSLTDSDLELKAQERITQVEFSREYTNRRVGFFTKQEVTDIKSELTQMTSQDKMGVIDRINALPKHLVSDTYNQFGGAFAFAGNLAASGNGMAAKTALIGKGADVVLPESFTNSLKLKIADAYGGYNGEYYSQSVDGLVDYAKGIILSGGTADDVGQLLKDSVGEMRVYNSKTTILPQGVEKDNFESWLDNIVVTDRPGLTKGLNDMTDMFFDGDYQLHYAGHGEYYVKIKNNGSPYFAKDSDNPKKPFVLKYKVD